MFEHFLPKQPPRSRVERARDQFSIYSRPFFNFEPRPELKKKNLELYSRTTTENVTGIESEKTERIPMFAQFSKVNFKVTSPKGT